MNLTLTGKTVRAFKWVIFYVILIFKLGVYDNFSFVIVYIGVLTIIFWKNKILRKKTCETRGNVHTLKFESRLIISIIKGYCSKLKLLNTNLSCPTFVRQHERVSTSYFLRYLICLRVYYLLLFYGTNMSLRITTYVTKLTKLSTMLASPFW